MGVGLDVTARMAVQAWGTSTPNLGMIVAKASRVSFG